MPIDCGDCFKCCKHIEAVLKNKKSGQAYMLEALNQFPYGYDERGWCEKLTIDGKCAVYEDRPLVCDTDKMAKFQDIMPEAEYRELNMVICRVLVDE